MSPLRRLLAGLGAAALAAALAACAAGVRPADLVPRSWGPAPIGSYPAPAVPADAQYSWRDIMVRAAPVALNAPAYETTGGAVTFAGALHLTTRDTDQLHGLSDIKFTSPTEFLAVTDVGWLVAGRVTLDAGGRLADVEQARIRPLLGETGDRLADRPRRAPDNYNTWADAEGLAILPDGGLLISFEHQQRIWLYGRDRQGREVLPRSVPSPPFPLDYNSGFEALAIDGAGGFWAAPEASGLWRCSPAGCMPELAQYEPPLTDDTRLRVVSMDADPFGQGIWVLERSFAPAVGNTIRVSHWPRPAQDEKRTVITLERPMTVDNFEGIAVVRHGQGRRVHLISDDNFNARQRTLLMAFDVR